MLVLSSRSLESNHPPGEDISTEVCSGEAASGCENRTSIAQDLGIASKLCLSAIRGHGVLSVGSLSEMP